MPPSQFIIGQKSGEDDGGDLVRAIFRVYREYRLGQLTLAQDDDTQICSCHVRRFHATLRRAFELNMVQNVSKGDVVKCCKAGTDNIGDIKKKTKAGTGCGGCMPLVTNIFKAEMKKAGKTVSSDICIHFKVRTNSYLWHQRDELM